MSVGNVWSRVSKLTAADGLASDGFARTIYMFTTTAVIGTEWDDDVATDAGIIYKMFDLLRNRSK